MKQFTTHNLSGLLADHEAPCISLYLPTHRFHPDNQQDPIRYRNLLKEMESSLRLKYPKREVQPLLKKFQAFAHDDNFWNHRTEGLAILCSTDTFQFFELQRPVTELLVVADSFHTKPLVRSLQAADRYQILGFNRHEAKLYEGNRDALDEVELADGVPRTLEHALGDELTEPYTTVASYGGSGQAMHHGQGQKKDEVEIDNERFFRAVDRAVLEHHSRPSGLPLMLAALPEHHDLFHKVSHNPFLMSDGIKLDPQSISADRLRAEAWQVMEPHYSERLAKLVDNFEQARSRQLGSSDLSDVARALVAGRVGMLLIEANRQVAGKLDSASGSIEFGELAQPDVDDLLDDLAELTLKMGGEVTVVPAEQIPSETGAAATYRF